MKAVKVHAQSAGVLDLAKLTPFQGAFKGLTDDNYRRFRKQLLAEGVNAAFTVWRTSAATGKTVNYILDGHQRHEVLTRMEKEGYEIPPLPVTWTDCKDKAEAKRRLMGLASTYGDVNPKAIEAFALDAGLQIAKLDDQFRFPGVDFADLSKGSLLEEPSTHAKKSSALTHKCPKCGHKFGRGAK